MPIRYDKTRAVVEGHAAVEEAGDLAAWLIAGAARKVDLAACTGMHAAVLQCLMALTPHVTAAPQDETLARWLAPVLVLPEDPPPAKPARRRRKVAA
ncbi:hypothetical protein [Erythrobacter oryzae]|uniref:hypothetical protein n=1 Tax=Erythrobacter oryzae TaxID=3019556 RepID=UPI0025555CDE|nr:hypothetical protein [Erythrobacter sp. COR-2]